MTANGKTLDGISMPLVPLAKLRTHALCHFLLAHYFIYGPSQRCQWAAVTKHSRKGKIHLPRKHLFFHKNGWMAKKYNCFAFQLVFIDIQNPVLESLEACTWKISLYHQANISVQNYLTIPVRTCMMGCSSKWWDVHFSPFITLLVITRFGL